MCRFDDIVLFACSFAFAFAFAQKIIKLLMLCDNVLENLNLFHKSCLFRGVVKLRVLNCNNRLFWSYQICTLQLGQCFRPQLRTWSTTITYVRAKNVRAKYPNFFIPQIFRPKSLASKLSHFSAYNPSLCWVGPPERERARQILVKNVDNKDVATLSQFLSGESESV